MRPKATSVAKKHRIRKFARGSKAQRKLPFRIVPDRRREAVGLRPLIPAKLAAFFRIRYVFSITRLTGCTEMLGTGRLRAKGSIEHRSSNGKHARMFHVKHLCVAMPRDVGSVAAPASWPLRRRSFRRLNARDARSAARHRGRAAARRRRAAIGRPRPVPARAACGCAREPRRRSVRW